MLGKRKKMVFIYAFVGLMVMVSVMGAVVAVIAD